MPPESQPQTNSFAPLAGRLVPRAVAAMPVQRGNYGIPPRQAQAGTTPQVMDVSAPGSSTVATPDTLTPVTPNPAVAQPVSPPVAPAEPMIAAPAAVASEAPAQPVASVIDVASTQTVATSQPTPAPPAPVAAAETPSLPGASAPTPLFTPSRALQEKEDKKSAKSAGQRGLLRKVGLVCTMVGVLLVAGGVARWITAGSTGGKVVAVGAVSANDGGSYTVQFTADDGQVHKFTRHQKSTSLIPGTAVQVAYQSGAPDKTVVMVSDVKNAHQLATTLLLVGGVLTVAGVVIFLVLGRKIKK